MGECMDGRVDGREEEDEEEILTTLISWMKASPKATSTFWVMFSTGLISLL